MTASAADRPPPGEDESTRFVLPAGHPLLANLAALWLADPALAGALEALDDAAGYPVKAAKSGAQTVALPTPDGRTLYLHSRHHPADEAGRWADGIDAGEKTTFYVLGFGLGYHVDALLEKISGEAMLCVFEPDLRLLLTAFARRDFTTLIGSKRVMFFWKDDKSDVFARLSPHSALVSLGFEAVPHAPSLQLHPEFFRRVQVWIGEFASFTRTSMNTLVLNSAKTAENIAANIGWYAASPSIARLKGRHARQPAVIVSAGPSLRKNKHLLKGLEEKAVLIAVQTTLQPLLEMGVEPQYVTSLDYHEICARFFEKLPRVLRTELVAEPKATGSIFRLNPGPLTVLGNDFAEGLLREVGLGKPALPAGATVAHLAYYLAEHMGCDPIVFVGQDLAFGDGLCYAPGTSYEDVWRPELSRHCSVEMKQWEQVVRDRYILRRIPDQNGQPVYTEERLFTYLQQFERDFGKSRSTIIDATEGGAMKRGAVNLPLAEVIDRYCRHPLPPTPQDHPGLDWGVLGACVESLEKRREEGIEIGRISRAMLPLLEDIRDHLHDQKRVNRTIGRVDELRARMDGLGRTYDMVTQLTQQTELQRFERDRRLAASKAQGAERQRRQVERDVENVRAVTEAAEAFRTLMTDVIERLSVQALRTARPAAA